VGKVLGELVKPDEVGIKELGCCVAGELLDKVRGDEVEGKKVGSSDGLLIGMNENSADGDRELGNDKEGSELGVLELTEGKAVTIAEGKVGKAVGLENFVGSKVGFREVGEPVKGSVDVVGKIGLVGTATGYTVGKRLLGKAVALGKLVGGIVEGKFVDGVGESDGILISKEN
jgi:hypothetical protein